MQRLHFKPALIAALAATLASSLAAWAYGVVDFRSYSPWIIVYAPIVQGVLVALPTGFALGLLRRKLERAVFVPIVTTVAGLLGFALAEWSIGYSPHFSHERAGAFLTVSWAVAGLVTSAIAVYAPNTSLERTRDR